MFWSCRWSSSRGGCTARRSPPCVLACVGPTGQTALPCPLAEAFDCHRTARHWHMHLVSMHQALRLPGAPRFGQVLGFARGQCATRSTDNETATVRHNVGSGPPMTRT